MYRKINSTPSVNFDRSSQPATYHSTLLSGSFIGKSLPDLTDISIPREKTKNQFVNLIQRCKAVGLLSSIQAVTAL